MNTPSRFERCPYEDRYLWFKELADRARDMGMSEIELRCAMEARDFAVKCEDWHAFKRASTRITDEVSRIMTARWAK